MNEGLYDAALRTCHGGGTAELQSLKVQTLLRMNRPDLAWSELQQLLKLEVRAVTPPRARCIIPNTHVFLTSVRRTTRA